MNPILFKIVWLLLLVVCFGVLNLTTGAVAIPLADLWAMLWNEPTTNPTFSTIVFNLRLPNTLMAIAAGGSLSIAGLLMQTFFRNPIAGPYILGVSSGASLGVAMAVMAFPAILQASAWGLVSAASIGAMAVLMLLLMVAWRITDGNTLLILGLMLGSATGAIIELLQYFSSQQELQRYIFWTMGSLQGTTWREIGVLLPLVAVCWVGVFVLAKPLNALLLGEEYAQTMGVSVNKMKIGIIVITAILAGSITAFCGPIAFVGTAVPHLARWLFRTSQHHILLVGSILIGVLVLLVCQWLAHLPLQNRVLPVNALTSLLGAPVVIIVVMRLKNS